jgi:membrane associated rhomboid family serine protease
MKAQNKLYFSNSTILVPLAFVVAIWLVFWAEIRFGLNLKYYGIYPQRIEGLRGIVFGPFIHGSLRHLFNNSIPLFVLSAALFYFYRNIKWKVLLIGVVVTGILTWLIGRPAYHIGASGVVYLLAAFLFFKGIFSKQYQLTALAFVVVFLYGSLLWYVFPIDPKISWEGHLSGFLVGIALSLIFWKNPIETKKYVWQQEDYNPEEDAFLKHFDEDGNFIENRSEIELEEEDQKPKSIKITYRYKQDTDKDVKE